MQFIHVITIFSCNNCSPSGIIIIKFKKLVEFDNLSNKMFIVKNNHQYTIDVQKFLINILN